MLTMLTMLTPLRSASASATLRLRLSCLAVRPCTAAAAAAPARLLSSTTNQDEPFLTLHHDTLPDGSRTGVVELRLNRPSSLNALTAPMGDAFSATLAQLAHDPNLRALILTGTGRAFSAGGDLDFLRNRRHASNLANTETMRAFYARFLAIRKLPVPTIAKINGPAVGAGFCLAMATDMRLTVDSAKVGFNFVKLGITPGMGAQTTVETLVGTQNAARLLLTGDLISGSEAERLGLVLASHKTHADLDQAALALARSIASASPVAVRMTTKSLRLRIDEALTRGLAREADTQALCYTSPDFKEGIEAISEKRAPVFPMTAKQN